MVTVAVAVPAPGDLECCRKSQNEVGQCVSDTAPEAALAATASSPSDYFKLRDFNQLKEQVLSAILKAVCNG